MKMKLLFLTTNRGKFADAQRTLERYGITVDQLSAEVPEPRKGLEEIAVAKLRHARAMAPAGYDGIFVVDAGVYVAGLEWPGPFTNFELKTLGMKRILKLVEFEGNDRLEFRNVLAFSGPGGERIFRASHKGRFATTDYEEFIKLDEESRKSGLVPWSPFHPLWIPEGFDRPWFMLSDKEKSRERGKTIFTQLAEYLSRRHHERT